ncbi:MAG TPA: class I SAM-dependent methyltransferase [Nitrospira sp.]|nr:class I SAM-dependent methyltransferase [Nitrospira sp.]
MQTPPDEAFAILGATMGLYRQHIFPRLMDWVMSGEEFQRLRASLLRHVHGGVLEIGFGTGLNLPHYPDNISSLSIVDPAQILPDRLAARRAAAAFPVHTHYTDAETLPFPDRQFDSIVSTWTLCTIPDPVKALQEIRRVLKPAGIFLFLEHGRSDDAGVAAWQDRLNPIQNMIGCGCNLNRRIDRLIEQGGLQIDHLERFRMPSVPRIAGEMYEGRAVSPTAE